MSDYYSLMFRAVAGLEKNSGGESACALRTGSTLLKTKNVHSEVTARDLETGKTTSVKHPLQK